MGSSKSRNKLACFYFYVGNIGTRHCSSLKNIFVALVVKADTLKKHCLDEIVSPLFQQFQTEGIIVENHTSRIYGSIATISADNLGAHQIAGLRRCFSSGRICRFCMCVYTDLRDKCAESDFMSRIATSHKQHVEAVTKDETLAASYGVVQDCAFHVLTGFSAVTAFPPDLMHDCLKGVLPQFLQYLFRHLHNKAICSFSFVNEHLKKFKFGQSDQKNKPRPLPGTVVMPN